VIASIRLTVLRLSTALGVEVASAVLPANVGVDEGGANATAVVKTQLRLGQPLAGNVKQAVFNLVAGA
jgi:hypothetical protein